MNIHTRKTICRRTMVLLSCSLISFGLLFTQSSVLNAASNRDSAVAYMRSLATIIWKPKTELKIIFKYNPTETNTYQTTKSYRGIPYSQAYVTPYTSNTSISPSTGFTNKLTTTNGVKYLSNTSTGNDCCDSLLMAWRSCGFSITGMTADDWSAAELASTAIANRLNSSGIRMAGPSWFGTGADLSTVFSKTSLENASQAYEILQAGDALVKSNHVMMVVSVDQSLNRVKIIDQYGFGITSGSTFSSSSWRVDSWISYEDLYYSYYLPVRIF